MVAHEWPVRLGCIHEALRTRDLRARLAVITSMYEVNFETVSTVGLEASPVAPALAGLRANEARYFKNKYGHTFAVQPAADAQATVDWVHRILKDDRDLVIESRPLEATQFEAGGIRFGYVFYESGLAINVMYTIDDAGKRAAQVGHQGLQPVTLMRRNGGRQIADQTGTVGADDGENS